MILNMVGGGGGSLKATDALLRVEAPAGSTVTITKGGVTKTDLGHENADDNTIYDYYFIIHSSQFDSTPWTVTATLGAESDSATIIINAADEYDLVLSYIPDQVINYLLLYADGVQDTETAGGLTYTKQSSVTLTDNSTYLTIKSTSSGNYSVFIGANNAMNLGEYVNTIVKWSYTSTPQAASFLHSSSNVITSSNTGTRIGDWTMFGNTGFAVSNALSIGSTTQYYGFAVASAQNSALNLYDLGLVKEDDLTELVSEFSLTNSTADTILASSADINILLGSEKAVRWMCALCTGDFMAKAIKTAAFMTAYASSAYKTIIDANTHWAKFLAMVA